jgi:hypothetical protein
MEINLEMTVAVTAAIAVKDKAKTAAAAGTARCYYLAGGAVRVRGCCYATFQLLQPHYSLAHVPWSHDAANTVTRQR